MEDGNLDVANEGKRIRLVDIHIIVSGGLLVAILSVAAWVGATDNRVEANANYIERNRELQIVSNRRIYDRLNEMQKDVAEIKGMLKAREQGDR